MHSPEVSPLGRFRGVEGETPPGLPEGEELEMPPPGLPEGEVLSPFFGGVGEVFSATNSNPNFSAISFTICMFKFGVRTASPVVVCSPFVSGYR